MQIPTKQECDSVATELLDFMQSKVNRWPKELAVAVMFGASVALAIACGIERKRMHEMIDSAADDIGIG